MKKSLLLFTALASLNLYGADFTDGNLRKNDFTWGQMNLYSGYNLANFGGGKSYNDLYLELEGGSRSGVLDLYYFFDVNNILNLGERDEVNGDFFTKITPRFSLDGMLKKDLSVGIVNEWFLATQYKGFNGSNTYYVGLGTNLDMPGFDRFGANIFSAYDSNNWGSEMEHVGYVLALNWYTELINFDNGANISYQGWSDIGFGNKTASESTEFQMFNGFFYNKGHYSASYSVKFHDNAGYKESESSDAISHFIGLSYRF